MPEQTRSQTGLAMGKIHMAAFVLQQLWRHRFLPLAWCTEGIHTLHNYDERMFVVLRVLFQSMDLRCGYLMPDKELRSSHRGNEFLDNES